MDARRALSKVERLARREQAVREERELAMVEASEAGATLRPIAAAAGVSAETARTIIGRREER